MEKKTSYKSACSNTYYFEKKHIKNCIEAENQHLLLLAICKCEGGPKEVLGGMSFT